MSSNSVSWPTLAVAVLSSGAISAVITSLLDRSGAHTESLRIGYATATDALNRWGQFPMRVRRRVDDSKETRAALEALGAQIQESLAYSTGWVSAESAAVGEIYNQLVQILRREVALHARQAWATSPASDAGKMNLGGPHIAGESPDRFGDTIPAEWVLVKLFSETFRYRFGWRRHIMPGFYLRWRFSRIAIVEQAKREFAHRPMRLLLQHDLLEPQRTESW